MSQNKILYLSGLNGLRAIASTSVVISHTLSPTYGDFGIKSNLRLPLAEFGVTLFFVISGFLITYLLLNEQDLNDKINVKKFYFRRILRIWPIYYLSILLISLLSIYIFKGELEEFISVNLIWYILFAANIPFILSSGIKIITHFWSIGVEEQFYLVWPLFIKYSNKNLNIKIIFLVTILIAIKLLVWQYIGKDSFIYRFISVTRIHCMMVGAIGSILFYRKNLFYIDFFCNKWVQYVSWSLFVLIGAGFHVPAVVAHELFAIISLVIIIGQINFAKGIFCLETKLLNFLGKLSYGIYVYHPLVIFILAKYIRYIDINKELKFVLIFSTVIVATILISYFSYEYYEKYFIQLKTRLAVVKSTNEPQRC